MNVWSISNIILYVKFTLVGTEYKPMIYFIVYYDCKIQCSVPITIEMCINIIKM